MNLLVVLLTVFAQAYGQYLLVFKTYAREEISVIDMQNPDRVCKPRSIPDSANHAIHGTFFEDSNC